MDGIIKKRKKLRIPWAESSKNGENCKFRGRNRQKTEKTADSVDGIIKKRRKLRILWAEYHQKTAKTANSVDRIIKKRQKLQIPWAESSEIGQNCKFCGQNHQKSVKTAFPKLGKSKITQKQHFPTLIRLFFLIFAYKIKDMIWK